MLIIQTLTAICETARGSQAAHVLIKVGVNKDKGRYATRNDRSQEWSIYFLKDGDYVTRMLLF